MPADCLSRDIVLFSTADWDHPFWTNKQRVASGLAERGFRVLYVESLGLRRPTASGRDLRRMARRAARALTAARPVAKNIWVCSPLVLPAHASSTVRQVNQRLLTAQVRRSMARLGMRRPIAWTYNPLVGPLMEGLDPSLVVYHAVDDLSAAPGVAAESVRAAEVQLARQADVVFATSLAIEQRLNRARSGGVRYLPNVADYEHFSRASLPGSIPADLAQIPRPRIGFVGAVSPYKVDFDLIATLAQARPDWQWVLVGQVGEGQPQASADRLQAPNIHLLGPRPYAALPDYLRGFDVATIPAARNSYTQSMFPMKFFEYLAAGRPVVVSGVPAVEPYREAAIVADTPAEFAAAIDRVLAGQGPDPATGDRLARQYTWDWRLAEMLSECRRSAARRATLRAFTPLAADRAGAA